MTGFKQHICMHDTQRWRGLRIGLLGGSFDPAHYGHVEISLTVLKKLQLDYIWWLVSPQNPLKEKKPASFEERFKKALYLTRDHPRIIVSDLEMQLQTRKSYDTICQINTRFPNTEFAWITGLDNAHTFHKWHRWRDILDQIATVHIARPPARSIVQQTPLHGLTSQNHTYVRKSGRYNLDPNHTYWILENPLQDISSTMIKEKSYSRLNYFK